MTNATIQDVLARITAFELPVPDLALVFVAVLLTALVSITSGRRNAKTIDRVERIYRAEMTRFSRQAQAAQSKAAQLKSDLERERRRNRMAR